MQDRKEAAVQVRTAGPPDAAELAQVQLEAALTGFAHIFPDAVPKPKLAAIEVDWAQLIADAGKTVLAATPLTLAVALAASFTKSPLHS